MKPIDGYFLIKPEDLHWRPSNLMKIPNADYLERTGSENLSARLWRLPSKSASTLHKHVRSEEFYFVLEGTGRIRMGDKTLTVPKLAGCSSGRTSCVGCSTTPAPRCSGSLWARRRNWPAWSGRQEVDSSEQSCCKLSIAHHELIVDRP